MFNQREVFTHKQALFHRQDSLTPFQAQQLLNNAERALQSLNAINDAGGDFDLSGLEKLKIELEDHVIHSLVAN